MTFVVFSNFGQKLLLCKEKMMLEVENFYLGLFISIPAFVVMLIEKKLDYLNYIMLYMLFQMDFFFIWLIIVWRKL